MNATCFLAYVNPILIDVCVCAHVCTHVLSNLGHETRKNTRVEEIVREKGVRKKNRK